MIVVNGLSKKTIFVSVTSIERQMRKLHIPFPPLSNYACGNWKLCGRVGKARQCEWLAAVRSGHIVDVWEIDQNFGWHPMQRSMIPGAQQQNDPDRWFCNLIPISAKSKGAFINQRARLYFPFDFNF